MLVTEQAANEIATKLVPQVNALLAATAYAQLERERVEPIQRKVLNDLGYEKMPLKQTYDLPDDVAEEYYTRLNQIHLADGFEPAAEGYCPALCAENLQLEAEWALIKAAQEFFPDIDNNRLLMGTDDKPGLELRQEYIDLLIGLVVNHPSYRPPLKRG